MKSKSIKNLVAAFFGISVIAMATDASAQLPSGWSDWLPSWTQTASSCAIDESYPSSYEFTAARFRFKGTSISPMVTTTYNGFSTTLPAPIVVRCNVTPVFDYVPAVRLESGNLSGTEAHWKSVSWNALIVGYQDPDGVGTVARVLAILKKVNRATLLESTVTTFDSNTAPDTTLTQGLKQFTHTFDFQNYEYYVELQLTRTWAQVATPSAVSVRLTNGSVLVVPN